MTLERKINGDEWVEFVVAIVCLCVMMLSWCSQMSPSCPSSATPSTTYATSGGC